jgi:hypothetical protein
MSKPAAYFFSTKHIAGCLIAVAPPALALTGVIAPLTGLALVPIGYAVGAAFAPKGREARVAAAEAHAVEQRLAELRRSVAGRIPLDLSRQVGRISKTITDTLPRASALGVASRAEYVLKACATDYLPSALQPYLDMPRQFADERSVAGGKTPRELLAAQLDLLEREITQIADAVNRHDVERLLINGRFLADRFGHPGELPT